MHTHSQFNLNDWKVCFCHVGAASVGLQCHGNDFCHVSLSHHLPQVKFFAEPTFVSSRRSLSAYVIVIVLVLLTIFSMIGTTDALRARASSRLEHVTVS